ncbi:hypothetical protein FB567DRAFT_511836 [Paraphoma chrysanthemicola]|uniref:Uncharacterized protein n=1 Tax=Paraphoma chrysanthemicola TaxID=798071 RepID=A0A8K0W4Q6_9PLEO|nr:hypothetical protein FB567DRAFT_511836 [Paraphoma chrysanthemicola]
MLLLSSFILLPNQRHTLAREVPYERRNLLKRMLARRKKQLRSLQVQSDVTMAIKYCGSTPTSCGPFKAWL